MESVESVFRRICVKASVEAEKCFIILKKLGTSIGKLETLVPKDEDNLLAKSRGYQVEIRHKSCYHVHLSRNQVAGSMFGLTIKTLKKCSLSDNTVVSLKILVSDVEPQGPAYRAGIIIGDEILLINGKRVKFMDANEIEQFIKENPTICLVARTKRISLPLNTVELFLDFDSSDDNDENQIVNLPCSRSDSLSGGQGSQIFPAGNNNNSNNQYSTRYNKNHESGSIHRVNYMSRNADYSTDQSQGSSADDPDRPDIGFVFDEANYGILNTQEETSADEYTPPAIDNDNETKIGNFTPILSKVGENTPTILAKCATLQPMLKFDDKDDNLPEKLQLSTMMSVVEKRLRLLLKELVETERSYAKDLENLITIYLEPLQVQTFLPPNDVSRLVKSCLEILRFHRQFLIDIEQCGNLASCNNNNNSPILHFTTEQSSSFENGKTSVSVVEIGYALTHVASVFGKSAAKFKIYSSYCAAYLHTQQVLRIDQNLALQKFLKTLNIYQEHSETFESYLIKPVQRILRYPLFLQQIYDIMGNIADKNQENIQKSQSIVCRALQRMEKVAEYINEMQRIYEQYGQLFDQAQSLYKSLQEKINLEVSDLMMFGEVCWLNASEDMILKSASSAKESTNIVRTIDCLCFVFRGALLLAVNDQNFGKNGRKTKQRDSIACFSMYRVMPLDEVKVSGDDVSAKNQDRFVWIIIHKTSTSPFERIYYLSNRKLDVKLQFLKAIKKAKNSIEETSLFTTTSEPVAQHDQIKVKVQFRKSYCSLDSQDLLLPAEFSTPNNLAPKNALPIEQCLLAQNGGDCKQTFLTNGYRSSQSDTGYGGSNCDLYRRV